MLAECATHVLMLLSGENLASLDWMLGVGKQDDGRRVPTNASVDVSLNETQWLDVEPASSVWVRMTSLFVRTTWVA